MYSEEGTGRGRSPPLPLLAVPNVIAHASTATSVPITVLLYNGLLLCGFNVPAPPIRVRASDSSSLLDYVRVISTPIIIIIIKLAM